MLPAWTSKVRNGQQGADDTRHPVIVVSEMMKGIKMNLPLKLASNEIGFPLPEIGIELDAPLVPQQGMQPAREVHVMKLHTGKRLLFQGDFKRVTVLGGGEDPQPMHAAQALHHVASHEIAAPKELRAGVCRAGKGTH